VNLSTSKDARAIPAACDVLVVGGGINGAGIARDLAGRGCGWCSCEKDDLGAHTSSASTKLIHGGLRYLEYYEFGWCASRWPNANCCCAARRTSCGRCAS
jgi:glycerol-3-phosphate dehydrogenase